ncbi:MAG: hypothetical protein V7K89_26390 [Nostoc sp.]
MKLEIKLREFGIGSFLFENKAIAFLVPKMISMISMSHQSKRSHLREERFIAVKPKGVLKIS